MIKAAQDKNSQKSTSYCSPLGLQVPSEGLMELFKAIRNLNVEEESQMTKMNIYTHKVGCACKRSSTKLHRNNTANRQ